jgi:hypothetical protein
MSTLDTLADTQSPKVGKAAIAPCCTGGNLPAISVHERGKIKAIAPHQQ